MSPISIRQPHSGQTHEPSKLRYKGPFKKQLEIADHYGFHLINPIDRKASIERAARKIKGKRKRKKTGEWYIHLADLFSEVDHYINTLSRWPQPTLISHTSHPRRQIGKVRLTVCGSTNSVAEALVLSTALAILQDGGHENLCVDINSLGDNSARATFRERYVSHVKQHLEDIHPAHQAKFKEDAFQFSQVDNEVCKEIRDCGPVAIDFLSSDMRRHFKEVLEYIGVMGTLFQINNDLIGSDHHESQLLFQIKSQKHDEDGNVVEENILARGERHESLPGKLGYQRSVPIVTISIDVPGGRRESYKEKKSQSTTNPQIYYVHLGVEAKQKSLAVLETLRREGIRVYQALCADRIRQQIRDAKNMQVNWLVIMGIKEVQEGSVIVRKMSNRSQEVIPLRYLPGYLKQRVK